MDNKLSAVHTTYWLDQITKLEDRLGEEGEHAMALLENRDRIERAAVYDRTGRGRSARRLRLTVRQDLEKLLPPVGA